MSRRTERLASTIRQELAQVILHELDDPRLTGLPTITRVKVSEDLSIADVYVTVMGTPGHQRAALNALRHSAGLMRTRLTKALSIRQTPFIKFHLDEAARKEIEILELLHKINQEKAQKEGGGSNDPENESQDGEGEPKSESSNQLEDPKSEV